MKVKARLYLPRGETEDVDAELRIIDGELIVSGAIWRGRFDLLSDRDTQQKPDNVTPKKGGGE
jgi:hypothetical protein